MRQRHHERGVGPHDPVQLAEHATQILHAGERVHRHHQLDAVRPQERQVGSEEPLDPVALRLDEDGIFRTTVKAGAFEARFSRNAQLELAGWLEENDDGSISLVTSSARVRVS